MTNPDDDRPGLRATGKPGVRGVLRRARQRIGRRGAFLAFLAVLDSAFGYSLLIVPRAALARADFILPVHAWGWIWIGTGVICATGILARADRAQYTAAALLKTAWGLLYAWLWAQGSPAAWISVTVWLSFALVIVLVAGWPEELEEVTGPRPLDDQAGP